MTKEYVEFKKERDLGSIITDAFKFIRLEWKSFFGIILKMAIIPMVIAVIAMVYYMGNYSLFIKEQFDTKQLPVFFISLSVMMIAYLAVYIIINLAGMFYIKSYIDNKGNINKEEIIDNTKKRFSSFIGFGVLSYFIIIFSVMMCVLPIFYTMTALSLGASILVFENEPAGTSISKSFSFIKGHFFETLGVILIVGLLISVLGGVFQVPALIYQIISMGINIGEKDPTKMLSFMQDPLYILFNAISIIGQFLLYSVTLVTNVFLYFDINEQKNATGTFEKIESIGRS